jgi:ribosome-binding ATPase YchF (GTP1/OBG family)
VEPDLIELSEAEARGLLEAIAGTSRGFHQLIRLGFTTLGLQTYLTAGPNEARAWTLPVGLPRPRSPA